jgi:hypothetical protein
MGEPAPPSILRGFRILRTIEGAELVGDLFYFDAERKWAVEATLDTGLEIDSCESLFPRKTNWFVVIDSIYPFGQVEVYPSTRNGIKVTFPHQAFNEEGPIDFPWRTGKLCLDMPIHGLGVIAGNTDPIGDSEERLKWYLSRSVAWVRAAATGSLVKDGDSFELPHYPIKTSIRTVHDESKSSYAAWKKVKPGDWGTVLWDVITGIEKTTIAVAYHTHNGILIRANNRYVEKRHIIEGKNCLTGIWWLWPSPVILDPWQIPRNWDELRSVGRLMNINVNDCLRRIARTIRGKEYPVLLIGYPIPERYGQSPSEIHWQAVSLPELNIGGKPPNGFRANENGWWQRDRQSAFNGHNSLNYIQTENWHPDRMQARGRLLPSLRDAKIALIGCGALGSVLAELLVRGGVHDLLLIDHDLLVAGNLVRHTLTGEDIGKNKAVAIAQRLSSVAPFSSIIANDKPLPVLKTDIEELLEDHEIVIDCTAADDVSLALSLGWWSIERLFVSAFVGYEAKRTFLFSHQGHTFPHQLFHKRIDPLLLEEKVLWSGRGETLEGAGCWSPLFPARLDDILVAASSCIKVIEELVEKSEMDTRLITFEQISDQGFSGLRRIEASANHTESSG